MDDDDDDNTDDDGPVAESGLLCWLALFPPEPAKQSTNANGQTPSSQRENESGL